MVGALTSAREHDLEHELLEAGEIHARFPGLELPDELVGVYQPDGGFVLSERAIAGHAALALEAGAEIHGHEPVLSWEARDGGVVVRTTVAEYRARRLIVSAGAWVGKLVGSLAPIAVPERRVLLWAATMQPELFTPDALPIFILDVDEGLFYGFPEYGIPGLKIGEMHQQSRAVDPDDWDRSVIEPGDEPLLRSALARYLPQANGPALSLKTCMFTMTPDEHFIIDTLPEMPQAVVVSPCSGHGFKFSAVVGEIAADLALDGATSYDISMFSIDRFKEVPA